MESLKADSKVKIWVKTRWFIWEVETPRSITAEVHSQATYHVGGWSSGRQWGDAHQFDPTRGARWPGCSSLQLVESFPFRCKLPRTSSLPVLGRHMFSEPEKAPRQMLQVLTARNSWPGWRSERCAEEIRVGPTAPNIARESRGLFQMQNFPLHNIL